MYSSVLFFFFLILSSHTTLALIYNDKCTTKCNFPGMVCVNSYCKCDRKSHLFWTGARCAPCPNDWTMTETECLTFYKTAMTWEIAKSTCQNVKAELISFRNQNMIGLVYNATSKNPLSAYDIPASGWTSAHATDLSGSGSYRWLDNNIKPFNDKSEWWCKKTTLHLGYPYQYNEPTKLVHPNETEACALYWRGATDIQVVCLDDRLCSSKHTFICEKSESTATQHLGPPPVINNLPSTSNTDSTTSIKTTSTTVRPTNIKNTSDTVHPTNVKNASNTVRPTKIKNATITTPKTKKESNGIIIIIIVVIVLLILSGLIGSLIFYLKRRNTTEPRKSDISKKESIHPHRNTVESDLVLSSGAMPENIGVRIDTQKNKRGGYSKQQFDEFE